MQIQQRQHFGRLRRLAHQGGRDRRRVSLPFNSSRPMRLSLTRGAVTEITPEEVSTLRSLVKAVADHESHPGKLRPPGIHR